MADNSSWLPNLLGPVDFLLNGQKHTVAKRLTVNFAGGVAITDNPTQDRTDIHFSADDVEDDIAKSDGTSINRVKGHNGVPFTAADGSAIADGAAPPVGGAWVPNAVGGSTSFKPKKPVMPGHYDVVDYGAIDDWKGGRTATTTATSAGVLVNTSVGLSVGQKVAITGVTGTKTITSINSSTSITLNSACDASVTSHDIYTDNWDAFMASKAAMRAASTVSVRALKLIVDGWFYLGQTFVLDQTMQLMGTGDMYALTPGGWSPTGAYSSPGSWLTFPKNIDGIRLRSASSDEPEGAGTGAYYARLKNIALSCVDGTTTSGCGINASISASYENVTAEYFGGHGFWLHAYAGIGGIGSCDQSRLYDCIAGGNKGDGFHLEGNECNACTVDSCSALANTGWGYYDLTGSGGTCYIGDHAEGNTAGQYWSDDGGNQSSYFHCYAEGSLSRMLGQVTIIGGNLSQPSSWTSDSTCFAMYQGTAQNAPFIYHNTRGSNVVESQLGESHYGSSNCLFQWVINDNHGNSDFSQWNFLSDAMPWVSVQMRTSNREVMRFPTSFASPRRPAPWFSNGLFLGDRSASTNTLLMAASAPPTSDNDSYPQTNEVGDFVLNSTPIQNAPLGFSCIQAGTVDGSSFVSATGSVTSGETLVTLAGTGLVGLQFGQHIAIAGVTGTKKVVGINGLSYVVPGVTPTTITIDSTASTTVSGAAITFVAPVWENRDTDHTCDVLTTNATTTRVRRNPLADGHVLSNRWIVQCRSTDNSGAVLGEWEVKACHKRVSGTASAAYTATITNNFKVGSPGDPTVTLNGDTDVDLNVTGAATNLTWSISEFSL